MKKIVMTCLWSILLLTGCATNTSMIADNQEDIETIYGTISQNEDGAFIVIYEDDNHQIIRTPIPKNTMILQDNSSIEENDLCNDENVIVSFVSGTMKVIQVIATS